MTESTPLAIEMWPIKKVLPYANNAKQHPDKQLDQLSESIKKFGFVNPVLVDASGVLIAGHGRVASAQKLGLKKIPVIQLGHLSEVDAKALRLSDNAIADRGVWSPELVELELTSLRALNFDLGPLGLDQIEFPQLDEEVIQAPPRANRSKTTIFVSVLNADVERARKVIVAALDRIKLPHNL
jgi:ParB-like nuclease domain